MVGRGKAPTSNPCGWPLLRPLAKYCDADNGLSRERSKIYKVFADSATLTNEDCGLSWLSRGETDFARTLIGRAADD